MAVSFDDLVVGQRYRVTKGPNEYIGVLIDKHVQTEEDKDEIHSVYEAAGIPPPIRLLDHVVIETDHYADLPIVDGPDVTYELLPAAGGRRRKSRRSHRKSRRSRRPHRKSKRNTRL